jgi:hypothetical protein
MSSNKLGKVFAAGSLTLLALSMLVMAICPASADIPAPPGIPTFTPSNTGQPLDSPHVDNATLDTSAQASGSLGSVTMIIAIIALGIILGAIALFIVFRK